MNKDFNIFIATTVIAVLAGCANNPLIASGEGGRYKVGGSYKIKGVRYNARENLNYVETGVASWYGADFHGKRTANGEIYNMHQLTAAHKTLPMPTYVRVKNLKNGRELVLRVNDRGPYKSDHGTDTRNRIIDVSRKAAELLGFLKNGMTRVEVRYLGKARPSDEGKLHRNIKRRLVPGSWRAVGESAGSRYYYIKTNLYKTKKQAERSRNKIKASKLANAKLQKSGKAWRLIIGSFEAKNEAEAAQAVLLSYGYNQTKILALKK